MTLTPLTGVLELIDFSAHVHVDDIQRRACLGRQSRGPQDSLDRSPGRARESVPFRRFVASRQGFRNQDIDDIPVLGVQHGDHPVFSSYAQNPKYVPVRQPQPPIVGREYLQAGNPHGPTRVSRQPSPRQSG